MAGFSDFLENKVLAHLFTATGYTRPSTYVALYTVAPTDSGGGTEVSGGSYARVQVTAWDVPSGGATANSAKITFPTASASWGTVVAAGIFDSSSGGNLLAWCTLSASKLINSGDTLEFPIGALDITLD